MLSHTVASAIRESVSAGEFMPGERLSEVAAAQRFSCSRNTLREAFAELVAEGLVRRRPNRGVEVAVPDSAYVGDLFLARAALEPAGARWGTFADPEELSALASSATAPDEAGRAQEVSSINQRFHRALVASLGSATLDEQMENLLARMRLTFLLVIPRYPSLHSEHIADNIALARLIAEGKRAEAADVCRGNLLATRDRILAVL